MKRLLVTFFLFILFYGTTFSQDYPTSNLIGYYPLDGTVHDESPNNYLGNYLDAQTAIGIDGEENSALFFNGTSEYAAINDNCNFKLSGTDYSISVWIKVDSFTQPIGHAILGKRCGADNQGFLLHVTGTDHSSFIPGELVYVVSGSSDPYLKAPTPIVPHEWYNIIITYDNYANTAKLYVNGELVDTNAEFASPRQSCSSRLLIGADPIHDYFFNGIIDELFFYNKVLSDDEISTLNSFITDVTDKIDETSNIQIAPNPNSGIFQIQTNINSIHQITVFDITGKVVRTLPFSKEISLNEIPTGMYSLRFTDSQGNILATKKIVIRK